MLINFFITGSNPLSQKRHVIYLSKSFFSVDCLYFYPSVIQVTVRVMRELSFLQFEN